MKKGHLREVSGLCYRSYRAITPTFVTLAQEAIGDLGRGHDLADVVPLLALVLTLLLSGLFFIQ